jgi:quercetin dioxygenase-like cupin family protein
MTDDARVPTRPAGAGAGPDAPAGRSDGALVAPGEGAAFFALTDWAICKVRAEWTGGRFSIVEQVTVPGARPPIHMHEFDEIHYIIEGEYDYWQGDRPPARATVGSVVWNPRGIPHTYQNIGSTNGRLLALFLPGGFEHFFEECGMPSRDYSAPPAHPGPAEVARLARIIEERYWTRVIEPLAPRADR